MPFGIDFGNSHTVVFYNTTFVLTCPTPPDLKQHLDDIYITHFFKDLTLMVYDNIKVHIDDVVLTAPVHFTDSCRSTIIKSAENVGWNVLRIINEPTAAALAYAKTTTNGLTETVLVIDCGGGTTDFSVVSMDHEDGIHMVKNTLGKNNFGGKYLTQLLVDYVIKKHNLQNVKVQKLTSALEKAKKILSFATTTAVCIECLIGDQDFVMNLSRATLEMIYTPFAQEFIKCVETVIKDTDPIDKVVLVGGSSRIPLLYNCIKKVLDVQICNTIDPDQAIAMGASILAENWNDDAKSDISCDILVDVLNNSVSIETEMGMAQFIVSKNTPLPVSRNMPFTNTSNTTFVEIKLYSGERKLCKYNQHIGTVRLDNLDDSLGRGEMKINVTLDVDQNGMITVSAFDTHTNKSVRCSFNRPNGHSEDDLETKIDDLEQVYKEMSRNSLYTQFLELLYRFHLNKPEITRYTNDCLNDLFNWVFNVYHENVLADYTAIKNHFTNTYHFLLFYQGPKGTTKIT
ncbi:hypothetical protein EB118_10855 [bacterium]|nr:hypothetical protein [bacterium]NDD83184.1 hypothetical protein [bacterium]NDG30554.1 hypothetical protein [bacterium]